MQAACLLPLNFGLGGNMTLVQDSRAGKQPSPERAFSGYRDHRFDTGLA